MRRRMHRGQRRQCATAQTHAAEVQRVFCPYGVWGICFWVWAWRKYQRVGGVVRTTHETLFYLSFLLFEDVIPEFSFV